MRKMIVLASIGIAILAWPLSSLFRADIFRTAQAQQPSATNEHLKAEIESLKRLLPDQAHAMVDVGYHFSNLWFAEQAGNWPLADFYFKETKSHLQWAVRIKPIRQDLQKQNIDLGKILESLEQSPLKNMQEAIAEKNHEKFVAAYKFTLEGCYACHKASDKPYLRPQIPLQPDSHIINTDPKANWPR